MDRNILVKLIGRHALYLHADTTIPDRWRWLRKRLPVPRVESDLLDVGCGTGAFSIGAALRGYRALGLTWSESDRNTAGERANILLRESRATFELQDIRHLDRRTDLCGKFDVVICCEVIEHVLDDHKLLRDMVSCLKPGGRLLLTAPNYHGRPVTAEDAGPRSVTEDGGHVRQGYTPEGLREMCNEAALTCEEVSFCTGFLSQKITGLLRVVSRLNLLVGWSLILPLRVLPPLLDGVLYRLSGWPWLSICLVARRKE